MHSCQYDVVMEINQPKNISILLAMTNGSKHQFQSKANGLTSGNDLNGQKKIKELRVTLVR